MTSTVEVVKLQQLFEQSRARDMAQLNEMLQSIISNRDDISSISTMPPAEVTTVMRSLQEVRVFDSLSRWSSNLMSRQGPYPWIRGARHVRSR